MEPILDSQQTQLRDGALRLCKDFSGPARLRALQAAGQAIDGTAWQQIGEAGWPLLLLPEGRGGLGLGVFELSLALLAAGEHLLLAPVAAACAAVHALGRSPAPAVDALLQSPLRLAALAIDETDVYAGGARWPQATPHAGGGRVLRGEVATPLALEPGQTLLLPARDAEDAALLLAVPANAAGVMLGTRPAIDGSRADTLRLDAVALGAEAVIARGEDAERLIDRIADVLLLSASAEAIGLAARALDMTLDHLKTRRQFGKPLAAFQALQHQCVNVFLDLELNRSLLYRTASAWDRGAAQPPMIAALKARSSRAALAATRAAVQLHGAMGYTEAHDIGLYYKRAVVLAATEGNENHHAARFSAQTWPEGASA